ncbi:unnamed protein product [Polarella glacialis]|uniref:Uncharacterized protein n=1 Tax=Polarella glacialis TaxID=89957 RepID=A0A813KN89_POLGL|nr:unnamed protein product [Polarella glacialis]
MSHVELTMCAQRMRSKRQQQQQIMRPHLEGLDGFAEHVRSAVCSPLSNQGSSLKKNNKVLRMAPKKKMQFLGTGIGLFKTQTEPSLGENVSCYPVELHQGLDALSPPPKKNNSNNNNNNRVAPRFDLKATARALARHRREP